MHLLVFANRRVWYNCNYDNLRHAGGLEVGFKRYSGQLNPLRHAGGLENQALQVRGQTLLSATQAVFAPHPPIFVKKQSR